MAEGGYLERAEPVLLVGDPGTGKSHLATGLAIAACRQRKRVRFTTAAALVNQLVEAQREQSLSRMLARWSRVELIVIDELGYVPLAEVAAEQARPTVVHDLDESQAIAATWDKGPLLVDAGPGTGKTRTLVHRIQHLLGKGAGPGTFLALTFSNKAAEEMRERLAAMNADAAIEMWVGTFRAFGLELLRKWPSSIRRTSNVRILDQTGSLALLESQLERLPLHHFQNLYEPAYELVNVLRAISRCKDELISCDEYQVAADSAVAAARTDDEREVAEKVQEIAKIYRIYEQALEDADSVDFGDLVKLAVELVQNNRDVQKHVAGFRHVLVDEFQDVNSASAALLRAICAAGTNVWVVADQRQSIYRFRGAEPLNVSNFTKVFGGTRHALANNYRSFEPIVRTFEHFSWGMRGGGTPGTWKAIRTTGGHVSVTVAPTVAAEGEAIAATITRLRGDGLRVMTIHGSKGLEFRAVHFPGIATGYMPSSWRGIHIPAPPSLPHLSMREDGHHAEEECLFSVCLSRAQDHLSLSRADLYTTRKSSESRFLASIGGAVPIVHFQGTGKVYGVAPTLQPPGSREAYAERDLDLYMQCPARYSYTVIEGLRGSRAESAYLRFHRSVYITIRWLEEERQEGRTVDGVGALSGLAAVWEIDGPVDHAFEKYYRAAAESMVIRMAAVIASETGRYEREEWSVPVGARRVLITPDRVWIGSDGIVRVQRIRTGRQTKSELGKPIYALMRRGARLRYPGRCISVEVFYLATNESVEVVAKDDAKLIAAYADAIKSIEAGDFHANPDPRRCPNCPCYFTCAPVIR